jgi:hypothetical protein
MRSPSTLCSRSLASSHRALHPASLPFTGRLFHNEWENRGRNPSRLTPPKPSAFMGEGFGPGEGVEREEGLAAHCNLGATARKLSR